VREFEDIAASIELHWRTSTSSLSGARERVWSYCGKHRWRALQQHWLLKQGVKLHEDRNMYKALGGSYQHLKAK
jgi:hypothetical protein